MEKSIFALLGELAPVKGVGFSAGITGFDQQFDLFPPEWLPQCFLRHARPRDLLTEIQTAGCANYHWPGGIYMRRVISVELYLKQS